MTNDTATLSAAPSISNPISTMHHSSTHSSNHSQSQPVGLQPIVSPAPSTSSNSVPSQWAQSIPPRTTTTTAVTAQITNTFNTKPNDTSDTSAAILDDLFVEY